MTSGGGGSKTHMLMSAQLRNQRTNIGVGHKVDQICQKAAEGAVKLLQKLPNEKSTLRIMLNKEFPAKLRYQAWRLYLGEKCSSRFLNLLLLSLFFVFFFVSFFFFFFFFDSHQRSHRRVEIG